MTKPSHRRQHGIATMIAIGMALLVLATLAICSVVFATQTRRTRAVADQAQFQQLLHAAALTAQHHLNEAGHSALVEPVTLPAPQGRGAIQLHLADPPPSHADAVVVIVEANINALSRRQMITFQPATGGWQAVRVERSR